MVSRRKAILIFVISLTAFILHSLFGKVQWLSALAPSHSKNDRLNKYHRLIDDISECIIPSTSSPGAKEAGINKYIIDVIANCKTERDRATIMNGLNDLEDYCMSNLSRSFADCTPQDRLAVLSRLEVKERISSPFLAKVRNRLFGPPFLEQIKWLVVSGYCTSQIGATEGLAYDQVPNYYIACATYQPGQRCWATT